MINPNHPDLNYSNSSSGGSTTTNKDEKNTPGENDDATTSTTSTTTSDKSSKLLTFAIDMWDGYDVLVKRTEHGIDQCKELLEFFKRRVNLEEKFAKSVVDGFSKFKLKDEADTFQRGYTCLSMLSEAESTIHKAFAQNLLTNMCHPFTAFVKEMEIRRKKLVNDGIKLKNDYKDAIEAVRKSHQKYEKMCKEIESAKIELINVIEKEGDNSNASDGTKFQQLEKKVSRCEGNAILAEEEYKAQIKETNEFIYGYYQTKMTDNLNEFEQFESMRVSFIKSNIKNYIGLMSELPPSLESELNSNNCKQDWIDPDLDIQTFIMAHLSQKKLPLPFQFEPYVETKLISLNSPPSMQSSNSSNPNSGAGGSSPPQPSAAQKSLTGLKDSVIGFFNKSTAGLSLSKGIPKDENNINETVKSTPSNPLFGTDLEELMDLQKKTSPQLEIPVILVNFIQTLLKLDALDTEGIFRLSPIHGQIQQEKLKLDEGGDLNNITDVHLVASLLKHWLRDLPNSLISSAIYDEIIESPLDSWKIISSGIPVLHQKVLHYLIDFLVDFTEPEHVVNSKMDIHSLAVIFAPTLIRSNISDPQLALENSKKEVKVVECMIVDSLNNKKTRSPTTSTLTSSKDKINNNNSSQPPTRNTSTLSFDSSSQTNKSDSSLVMMDDGSEEEDFVQIQESTPNTATDDTSNSSSPNTNNNTY